MNMKKLAEIVEIFSKYEQYNPKLHQVGNLWYVTGDNIERHIAKDDLALLKERYNAYFSHQRNAILI